jgi:hypothetical protein
VTTLGIHIINQIMNGWRPTKSVLYAIQYVRLKYKYIECQCSKYCCIFDNDLYSNITSIFTCYTLLVCLIRIIKVILFCHSILIFCVNCS